MDFKGADGGADASVSGTDEAGAGIADDGAGVGIEIDGSGNCKTDGPGIGVDKIDEEGCADVDEIGVLRGGATIVFASLGSSNREFLEKNVSGILKMYQIQ